MSTTSITEITSREATDFQKQISRLKHSVEKRDREISRLKLTLKETTAKN